MIVSYFGESYFRLQSGETVLLVDPSNNRQKADVILRTSVSPDTAVVTDGEIVFPGEYELKGIEVQGYGVPSESTATMAKSVFLVTWEEIRFLFLGALANPPETELLKALDEPDIIFLPAGEADTLPPEAGAKLLRQLEPAVAIPYLYKNAEVLAWALGQKAEVQEKFVFKKKDLAAGSPRVVVLETKG